MVRKHPEGEGRRASGTEKEAIYGGLLPVIVSALPIELLVVGI